MGEESKQLNILLLRRRESTKHCMTTISIFCYNIMCIFARCEGIYKYDRWHDVSELFSGPLRRAAVSSQLSRAIQPYFIILYNILGFAVRNMNKTNTRCYRGILVFSMQVYWRTGAMQTCAVSMRPHATRLAVVVVRLTRESSREDLTCRIFTTGRGP